jgi:hypothetical protein
LLTFCPPAPDARTKLSCSSSSGTLILGVMKTMTAHSKKAGGTPPALWI